MYYSWFDTDCPRMLSMMIHAQHQTDFVTILKHERVENYPKTIQKPFVAATMSKTMTKFSCHWLRPNLSVKHPPKPRCRQCIHNNRVAA